MRSLFGAAYYAISMFLGFLLIMLGTVLLLTRNHWASKASVAGGSDGAAVVRRKVLGWGLGVTAAGVLLMAQATWLLIAKL